MSRHMWPLALATFAVGTDGFVIAGLLPAIGADLGVSVATAGQLVTAFAVTFAVGAPVLSWVTSGLDRRTALLGALVVFVVGNALTALAPVFALVLAARMLTALGAATITSSASSTAVALADPARRGRALALVLSGLTLATTTGLPLGHVDRTRGLAVDPLGGRSSRDGGRRRRCPWCSSGSTARDRIPREADAAA